MEFKWTKVHTSHDNDWSGESYIDLENNCRIDRVLTNYGARAYFDKSAAYIATLEAFKTQEEVEAWLREWIPKMKALKEVEA